MVHYILLLNHVVQSLIDFLCLDLVMHDIVGTMFNKRFMEELFKPQDTYSKKAMRTVFDRLAHASIMRLNSASMDKVHCRLLNFRPLYIICLSLLSVYIA